MAAAAPAVGSSPGGSSDMPITIESLRPCDKANVGKVEASAAAADEVRTVRLFSMVEAPEGLRKSIEK